MSFIGRLAAVGFVTAVLFAAGASAQGGDGRSDTAVTKRASSADKAPRKKKERVYVRPARPRPIPMGRVALLVNEGESIIELRRLDAEGVQEIVKVPSHSSSLIVRKLPAGLYVVTASKPGFFDETREFEIEKGKRSRVDIVLRPKLAALSVSANIADARITIPKIGVFDSPVVKRLVEPGRYTIEVRRRGYHPAQVSVELRSPGSEEILKVILEPLRIDSVLDLATENVDRGNFAEALELTNEVLDLNAAHARANFVFGLIGYRRGDPASIAYFLKAVRNGLAARFPIRLLTDPSAATLQNADLYIDRDGLRFRSDEKKGLDIFIKRADIKILQPSSIEGLAGLDLIGTSDFHGRPIEPHLTVLSQNAESGPENGAFGCRRQSGPRTCATDIQILYRLLSDWRSDGPPAG